MWVFSDILILIIIFTLLNLYMERIKIKKDEYQDFLSKTNAKTLNSQLYNRFDAFVKYIKYFLENFNEGKEFMLI